MNVSKEIILDLLPLYFDGEASEETQALVEKYFDENPGYAKDMKGLYEKMKNTNEKEISQSMPIELNKEDELNILTKTKKLNNFKTTLLFLGVFSLVIPMLILTFSESSMNRSLTFIITIVSLLSWSGYFMIRNRLKVK